MAGFEAIGYWFDDLAPNDYPRPQRLIAVPARAVVRRRLIAHLRAGALFESYRASSFCRFTCGVRARAMGHRDLFDGTYVWPEGLAHHVEAHAVRLPPWFVAHALAHHAGNPVRPKLRVGMIDDARWIAWGRAEGAAIDLATWQRPDAATVERVHARLRAIEPGHILANERCTVVLVRPGAVVVALRSSRLAPCGPRLAIVQLARATRDRAPPTTILAGWADWPG